MDAGIGRPDLESTKQENIGEGSSKNRSQTTWRESQTPSNMRSGVQIKGSKKEMEKINEKKIE